MCQMNCREQQFSFLGFVFCVERSVTTSAREVLFVGASYRGALRQRTRGCGRVLWPCVFSRVAKIAVFLPNWAILQKVQKVLRS